MLSTLTSRQKQIFNFLVKAIRENGYAPSLDEIGRHFGIASKNAVSEHLKALERKGYILRVGSRAIKIMTSEEALSSRRTRKVPTSNRNPHRSRMAR